MRFLLLALLFVTADAQSIKACNHSNHNKEDSCKAGSDTRLQAGYNGCNWTSSGCVDAPVTPAPTPQPTPPQTLAPTVIADVPVTSPPGTATAAPGTKDGYCAMNYIKTEIGNSGKFREEYTPVQLCNPPLVCVPTGDEGTPAGDGSLIEGTCGDAVGDLSCHGKQKPGISEGDIDDSNEATIRVTICHRTCSATNPWVRITIDDDAWNGTAASGCGHQQHVITDECSTKIAHIAEANGISTTEAREAIWGPNDRDYLIKWHGTRDYVRAQAGWEAKVNSQGKYTKLDPAEKAYWFNWERACPYVRRGFCCGTADTGPCCGPFEVDYTPSITLEKKAGPVHEVACPAESEMTEVYEGTAGVLAQYSYKITNTGNTYLCNLKLSDPDLLTVNEPQASFVDLVVDNSNAELMFKDIMKNGCLPPGKSVYAPCHQVLLKEENFFATVVGTPSYINKQPIPGFADVSATDNAGLKPLPEEVTVPPICPNEGDMTGTMPWDKCPHAPLVQYLAEDSRFGGLDHIASILNEKGPTSIFYKMELFGDAGVAQDTVKFKLDNPFDFLVDMYVEYRAPPFDVSCAKEVDMSDCQQIEPIEARCNALDSSFSLINVYFVSGDNQFNGGRNDIPLFECCKREEEGNLNQNMIKLAFKVLCVCPPQGTARKLRGPEA